MVILNNHIGDAIWCCNLDDGNGLWYNKNYTTQDWLEVLDAMSQRYSLEVNYNPMVIGVDLRNEIRDDKVNNQTANWGNGDANDWHKVA
jgi:endoglucanase